ncbi:SDR family NAD(P)-dependent oxidoreductase [Streptomyces sp. NBC_01497]|uniref:SDR family NAD(P)-dependent oxidoreductase n=1 Tax=Streptomyces sp. NBC_01497 TaxID=2903885 RepID=UPI002E37CD66|nr:SDR family NAD(P)-dependent oxidoreductase [Streptomyces sp. NBC_01497]
MSAARRGVGLVTGAGSGIGRAPARVFARSGAAVAGLDIEESPAAGTTRVITDEGGEATPSPWTSPTNPPCGRPSSARWRLGWPRLRREQPGCSPRGTASPRSPAPSVSRAL